MTIPTINELYQSVQTDLRNKLGITSIVGRVIINAFAAVQAAKLKIMYLLSGFIYKNIFPDTADPDTLNGTLSRFGYVKLGRYPYPAGAGEYIVEVTGEIGAEIPSNTTFKSLDTSTSPDKLFILDSTFTFIAETGSITLRAMELGVDAKLEVDDELQLTQPIAQVDSYGIVLSVTTGATEGESAEDYRAEILAAYKTMPMAGSKADFRNWGNAVSGVRQIYPYTTDLGEVTLYVEMNAKDSTDGHGSTNSTVLARINDVISNGTDSFKSYRPMGVFTLNVATITPIPIDVVITDLSDTDYLIPIKTAIEVFLLNIRPYIAGCDDINDSNKGILYEADIYNIVRNVLGLLATFTSLEMQVSSTPTTSYTFLDDKIPYINTVTNI